MQTELLAVEDGTIIDTKGWGGWEWTHGVGKWSQNPGLHVEN